MFGSDSVTFPLEGRDAKHKFGGLGFDTVTPFFWFKEKGDTTIRLRIHKGHEADRFTYLGKDSSFFRENGKWLENYDLKGIYSYLFYFPAARYEATCSDAEKKYGRDWKEKTSFNSKIPYRIWKIGPCHHLLVYRKKRYQMVDETPDDKEYTYVMFIYNLAAEEADDAVELDGGIRNDFRSLSEIR
ncbi:hypothetical protein GCM10023091_24140 [Ravibacter arvi]|uniref:Uncharacterized protein n=1 Tax=Ravibacter arvi TaxID=2051041 RepID=A0ABP8LYJ7_9BACT